jgi:hypothetical protein
MADDEVAFRLPNVVCRDRRAVDFVGSSGILELCPLHQVPRDPPGVRATRRSGLQIALAETASAVALIDIALSTLGSPNKLFERKLNL